MENKQNKKIDKTKSEQKNHPADNPSKSVKPTDTDFKLGSKENPADLSTPEGKAAFKEWLKTK
jgi:hypothetical protein